MPRDWNDCMRESRSHPEDTLTDSLLNRHSNYICGFFTRYNAVFFPAEFSFLRSLISKAFNGFNKRLQNEIP